MASITSLGIGSGLDVESLVSKLMSVEQTPINNIKKASAGLQTKISAYGQMQAAMSAMQTAAQKLSDPATWSASSTSSSDNTVVTVSGPNAGTQSHVITVSQLATAQSVASGVFTNANSTVGEGTLTIALGSWEGDPPVFTGKAGSSSISVNITATDTLNSIRDKLNAANAGVVASVVSDAAGTRLVIRSRDSGQTNGFQISASDPSLAALSYEGPDAGGMSLKQAAGNASFNMDGLDLSSESNTLSTVADGLTLTLLKTSTTAVNVGSSTDNTAIKKTIQDFVTAYNGLMNLMRDQTKYDSATKTAGTLQGDAKAISLQQMLRNVSGGSTTLGGAFARLADIGLDPGQNGTLTINSSKLDKALGNLGDLKRFFSSVDVTDASHNGFAKKWIDFASKTLGTDGTISVGQTGLQKRIKDNDKQISALQDHLDLMEKRLRAQYTALDTKMGQLNGLSAYVTKQFSNKSSG
ncbi:flagellar filament capping protein FliD [Mitsuaria sp. WAJ17]|uniref:flagellar filament capping protein FliD n=1 Tax=Mitsuaria sp. WAJ17 TaxID=2761452 RepID=UPI0015FF7D75|nr:flagellar filament capping protein FliD [Mitsuaria sp. WAJ17]MBB2486527.1 flagellar filament capping protein FliD [Mitsuaria sp. WAJ17]